MHLDSLGMESADSISERFPGLKFLGLFFSENFWLAGKRTYWFLTDINKNQGTAVQEKA